MINDCSVSITSVYMYIYVNINYIIDALTNNISFYAVNYIHACNKTQGNLFIIQLKQN